jgi:hypothetical protein
MISKNNLITNLLILIVGVIFICMQSRENVLQAIVVILGILFISAAVINMLLLYIGKTYISRSGRISGGIAGCAALLLGIWMTVSPGAIISVIVYAFAALLLFGGLYHIYMLAYGYRPLRFPAWLYICPTLLVIAGVAMFIIGSENIQSCIVMITGIAMVVFAVSSFLEMIGSRAADSSTLPQSVEK